MIFVKYRPNKSTAGNRLLVYTRIFSIYISNIKFYMLKYFKRSFKIHDRQKLINILSIIAHNSACRFYTCLLLTKLTEIVYINTCFCELSLEVLTYILIVDN